MSSLTTTLNNITFWQLVGFAGIGCFIMRWAVQLWFSKKSGVSTFPIYFWYFSIVGSLFLIIYFSFGNKDLIGILANTCACLIAVYNLYLRLRELSRERTQIAAAGSNG